MLNRIIQSSLRLLISENEISEEDIDTYYFGLECTILKILHYLSYIIVGVILNEVVSLFISACVFMPLRSHAGGYHAKTRIGCYIFSCSTVSLLCMANMLTIDTRIMIGLLIIADIVILILAPLENENNILSIVEKKVHRKKSYIILITYNVIIGLLLVLSSSSARYLVNGIILAAILLLLGKCKHIICKTRN